MKIGVLGWLKNYWKPFVALGLVAFVIREAGCSYNITSTPATGGNSNGTNSGGSTQISISPQTATLAPNGTLSLSATVKSFKHDSTVSWSIIGTQLGTITANGTNATYTAPTTLIANPSVVTVRVRMNEDSTQYAECHINVISQGLPNGVSIQLTPLSITLQPGQTQQFQATVNGSSNTGVVWTLVSGSGSLSATGLYSTPASINGSKASAIIQATALADTSAWAQATITIKAPADTTPCFKREIQPIIISNCTMSGCHAPGSAGELRDLSTYSGVMGYVRAGSASASKLYQSITGQGEDKMPPRGHTPLTSDQIALIARWINDGAKNTDCTVDTSGGGCDTSAVHYSSFVRSVIQNNCLGCHSGSSASKGIDLSTYQGVQIYALNGQLVGGLSGAPGLVLMPQNGTKLDACTIAQIRAWVNKGAPND